MSDRDSIALLRRVRDKLVAIRSPDAGEFAAHLAEFEAGAPSGRSLGSAFGFVGESGQRPWWWHERAARRDVLLRGIADRFFPGPNASAAATAIVRAAERYEAAGWQRHRIYTSAPPQLAGTVSASLFELLKTGSPFSVRTAERALARHEGEGLVAEDSSEDVTKGPAEVA